MTKDPLQTITRIAAGLVATLALLAFVLSYSSLRHLAAANGVGPWLAYAWPLLLDFAMVVFNLAILRANLRGEPAWYPWVLTAAFATLATVANVLDVATLGIEPLVIAASVKALAPVALVLAFELFMQMTKAELKRAAVVASLAELRGQLAQHAADLEQAGAALAGAKADFERQLSDLAARRDALQAELAELRKEKKRETSTAPAETAPDVYQAAQQIMAERGRDISGSELGRLLGKSESLGRRLKRELAPVVLNGNGHGHEVTP